jgi:hypothetical protein
MSQPTLKEIAIAWLNGATVQRRGIHELNPEWKDMLPFAEGVYFTPASFEYRLKPEPREFFLLVVAHLNETPVVRLYEYRADAEAEKEQDNLAGEIIHVREVMPE